MYYRWPRSIYRPTVDRYIGRLSVDNRPTIDRQSTDSRPIYRPTDGRCIDRYVAINCRSSIGQVSVKYRSSIGQVSAKYRFTYRPYRSEENRLRKSARFFRYMFRFGNGKIHCKVGRSCVINVVP